MLILDKRKRTIFSKKAATELTRKELKMLEFILKNNDRNNPKVDELVHYVWDTNPDFISQNSISQLTYRLRKKINAIGARISISVSIKANTYSIEKNEFVLITKSLLFSNLLTKLSKNTRVEMV